MEETKELRNEKRSTEETVECSSKPNRKLVARPMPPKRGQIKRQIFDQILRTRRTSQLEPDKWCIYRVPGKLRKANEAAYTPQLLSIGPFHHGKPELKDMETYKRMYYENFRVRSEKSTDALKRFIKDHQQDIFRCYAAGTIEFVADLVDVILVDACFIIQLFLLSSEKVETDYILRSEWLRKAVEHELILFENQLPYFLLEKLHKFAMPAAYSKESQEQIVEGNESSRDNQQYSSCSTGPRDHTTSVDQSSEKAIPPTFLTLTWEFFKDYSKEKSKREEVKPKHFTDLVRYFLCPPEPTEEIKIPIHNDAPVKSKYC